MSASINQPTVTVDELAAAGFTPEEIARLEALRAIGRLPEFCDDAELARLRFLRWLRVRGEIGDVAGAPARRPRRRSRTQSGR